MQWIKIIFRKFSNLIKVVIGRKLYYKPDLYCAMEKFGSIYGGWHVATNDIDADTIVYSFGVGEDATFDMDLIGKYDLIVNAFDPTPKSIKWVKAQNFPSHFIMHEYGVADLTGNVSFNPPENPDHVSYTLTERPETMNEAITVSVKTIGLIMKELGHKQIDILKMDIEGAEYDVIKDMFNSKIHPKQILVEFHHRFPKIGCTKTKHAIKLIKSNGYQLFSVSGSNEDFCFIRKN